MPTITVSALSVAANAKSADQFVGTDLQFAPYNALVQVFSKISATGLNIDLKAGGDAIVSDQPVPYTGTAGTLSVKDNVIDVFQVAAGSKMTLTYRNTTGGSLTADLIVVMTPL